MASLSSSLDFPNSVCVFICLPSMVQCFMDLRRAFKSHSWNISLFFLLVVIVF